MKRTQARHDRLERIAARADAVTRLPHRLVELAYREYARQLIQVPWKFTERISDILSRAPRGIAVVVVRGRKALIPRPVSTGVAFEPCEVKEPTPQLLALLSRTWPESNSPDTGDEADRLLPGSESRGRALTWARLTRLIPDVIWCGFFGLMLFQGMLHNDWKLLLLATWAVAPLLTIRIGRLLGGRTWWVVPRGLMYREHRLWRKEVRVRMITRATASLIVEMTGRVLIFGGDELLRNPWPSHSTEQKSFAATAIIAAWASNAPAPTTEQVLDFVGPDARLIE